MSSHRKACSVHHLPPMMAEFLLTPFRIAWPCPGLYGKSALAVEKEMESQLREWGSPLIPSDVAPVFSYNSLLPVFPNEMPISGGRILLLLPRRITATSTPIPAGFLHREGLQLLWKKIRDANYPGCPLQFHWQTSLWIIILQFGWNLPPVPFYPIHNWWQWLYSQTSLSKCAALL